MFEYSLIFYAPQVVDVYGNISYISVIIAGADDPEDLASIICDYNNKNQGVTIFNEYGSAYNATNAQIQDTYGNCYRSYIWMDILGAWAIG